MIFLYIYVYMQKGGGVIIKPSEAHKSKKRYFLFFIS